MPKSRSDRGDGSPLCGAALLRNCVTSKSAGASCGNAPSTHPRRKSGCAMSTACPRLARAPPGTRRASGQS
eukprot:11166522-Lingulodinium_polyedra.AAC.1